MQSLEDLRQRSRMVVLRLVAEAAGAPSDGQHQQHAHQDAGDPASHEQTANGDLADGAVHMAGAGVTAKPEQRSFCSAQNPASFGVWRSFRWKSIKRKSLKLLGTSRSFRLCYLKIGNLLVNRLHRGELDWW